MGEVLYASYLVARQAAKGTWKRQEIERVLGWSPLPMAIPDDCVDGLRPGLVSANRHFSQSPGLLPGYLIEFVEQWKERGPVRALARLRGPGSCLGVQEVRHGCGLARPAADRSPEQPRRCASDTTASRPRRHVRGNPEFGDHKNKITERFAYLVREPTEDPDRKLVQIRRGLEDELGRDFDFYDDGEVSKRWRSSTSDPWDQFVERARSYVDSGRMEIEEIGYKLEMGRDLASARNAVVSRAEDWPEVLKRALKTRPGHPIAWQLQSDFTRWCADYSEQAFERARGVVVARRLDDHGSEIRGFSSGVPRSALERRDREPHEFDFGAADGAGRRAVSAVPGWRVQQGIRQHGIPSTRGRGGRGCRLRACAHIPRPLVIDEAAERGLELTTIDLTRSPWSGECQGPSFHRPPPPPR